MTKSCKAFAFALCAVTTILSACATGQPTKSVLDHLPAQEQSAIQQAVQSDSYIHLPAWLPFTPTHGTLSKVDLMGIPPQMIYTIRLYNDSELLTIKEPYRELAVYNNPEGLHLSNGVPATFELSKRQSELSWATGPNESYTLYSEKISGGSVDATAGPDLTEGDLVKIAESIPTK